MQLRSRGPVRHCVYCGTLLTRGRRSKLGDVCVVCQPIAEADPLVGGMRSVAREVEEHYDRHRNDPSH